MSTLASLLRFRLRLSLSLVALGSAVLPGFFFFFLVLVLVFVGLRRRGVWGNATRTGGGVNFAFGRGVTLVGWAHPADRAVRPYQGSDILFFFSFFFLSRSNVVLRWMKIK